MRPPMLRLHHSNRYRVLVDALLGRLDERSGGVFAADQLIVPSAAVRRSLTLAIAERSGVCANVDFDFLAVWLWRQTARLLPGLGGEAPATARTLAWQLHAALGDSETTAGQPRLAHYLAGADDVMRYQLAAGVAVLFEQYATYRPEWPRAWQAGRLALAGSAADEARSDERWQAALWRRSTSGARIGVRAQAIDAVAALRALGDDPAGAAALPASAHVFALPAMPPLHLEWLRLLARWIDIDVYVVNPCREYWFEIVGARRLAALQARGQASGHETGNRLLASWGRQTQSHLGLLAAVAGDAASDESDRYEARGHDTLLARLQNAVLDLTELAPGSAIGCVDDRSVEVHVCHSLTRELEVLHDHLLGLFAAPAGGTLTPARILVVTPDLDAAGPLIDAVFATMPAERAIPYVVSGRARSQVAAPAQALLSLLALLASRFRVGDLLALLQQDIVGRSFALDADSIARVRSWLRAGGSRWALDAAHRAGFGVPEESRHTLSDGLDRLFLGYASPAGDAEPLDDLLPAGNAEGSDAAILGVFWHVVEQLRSLHAAVAAPLAGAAWASLLQSAIATFIRPLGDELEDVRELQATVRQLCADIQAGGEAVPLAVLRVALQQALDDPARGGVASGAVTFSSMASLRNLPFAVICAIGMNDGAFPSAGRAPEYDLMAAEPRPGDRQRRSDDRNLFLDLLLAAERSFYVSYSGRSPRDNAVLPPSVLVAELLDVLVPAIAATPASAVDLARARARLVVEHPLQPFAAAAFSPASDPRLRSFDGELAAALRRGNESPPRPASRGVTGQLFTLDAEAEAASMPVTRDGEGAAEAPPTALASSADAAVEAAAAALAADAAATRPTLFFSAPLPPPGPEWRTVTLPQLIDFFHHPSRALLRRRLRIEVGRRREEDSDDEPFLPDRLSRYALSDRLLPTLLAGADASAVRRLAEAGVELPRGALGRQHLESELAVLQRFAARVREATSEPVLPPQPASLDIEVAGEPWRLDVAFADLRRGGLVRWHYDEVRGRHVVSAWLAHLALCAVRPAAVQATTRWLAEEGGFMLDPVAEPMPLLRELLELYRAGLQEPLHFFAKSAWACWKGGREDRLAARKAWLVTRSSAFAEGRDAEHRLALRGEAEPIDEAFFAAARAVFEPALAHWQADEAGP